METILQHLSKGFFTSIGASPVLILLGVFYNKLTTTPIKPKVNKRVFDWDDKDVFSSKFDWDEKAFSSKC